MVAANTYDGSFGGASERSEYLPERILLAKQRFAGGTQANGVFSMPALVLRSSRRRGIEAAGRRAIVMLEACLRHDRAPTRR